MIHIENISNRNHELFSSRRGFLKGMLGAGAFVLSVRLMPEELFGAPANAAASDGMAKAPLQPGVYLAIDTDGTAYIIAHRSEMGSGSRTALPRIVADELDADWSRVKLVQAIGDLAKQTPTVLWRNRPADADPRGSRAVECAADGVLHEPAHRGAQGVRKKTGLRRAGSGGVKIGRSEKGRDQAEAAKRMALHRQRHSELRPQGHVHR